MIVPSGAVRVLVATRPVDFRKGMDGLAALRGGAAGATGSARRPRPSGEWVDSPSAGEEDELRDVGSLAGYFQQRSAHPRTNTRARQMFLDALNPSATLNDERTLR